MNKKLKQKWVKALRSGRYKQTTGMLQLGRAYCCLGVLCRIAGARKRPRTNEFVWRGEADWSELPDTMRADLGLDLKAEGHLVNMNDGGKTFDQIADYIEENL